MHGYKISDLDSQTVKLIKDKNIDKNNDGLISEDNGELAELLSQANVSTIQALGKPDNRGQILLGTELTLGGALSVAGLIAESKEKNYSDALRDLEYEYNEKLNRFYNNKVKALAKEHGLKSEREINMLTNWVIEAEEKNCDLKLWGGGYNRREIPRTTPSKIEAIKKAYEIKRENFIKEKNAPSKFTKFIDKNVTKIITKCPKLKGIGFALTLATAATIGVLGSIPACIITALMIKPNQKYEVGMGESNEILEQKPTQKIKQETEPIIQNETKSEFEAAFKELGIDEGTELKEYTPQKGEFWVSILKAKYDTDDITAQKMANKIKEMIYDDPKAAKQTPVMYLPETWTFEGTTYHYNENAPVEITKNYSDDVQTEMGKMSKDLKYE
ncbi:MAG: hypothetical protein NC408_05120 [Candidatus Gastranaerophilales bacterium]|nr:hypothetical protein [Candidatus Gastranaerophilales bacterium]MCM1072966.1 hypothetical protein [Bacteroides sp.]